VRNLSITNKYIRVNDLKLSLDDGFAEIKELYKQVYFDNIIPDLLVLPPTVTGIGELDLVKEGMLIIQDKASCFPSQILMDEWVQGDIVDACSAPGNKTSHVASQMFRKCSNSSAFRMADVYAFEKNPSRYKLLCDRMQQAGADDIVKTAHGDFLEVDWEAFPSVSCILLDPSCSGSGIAKSFDRAVSGQDMDKSRLENLRQFQLKALCHAMSCPSAEVVVYSTCSIHAEENEAVVAEALGLSIGWSLSAPQRLHAWARRGCAHEGLSAEESACLIRCLPEDGMNGFFVALFRRDTITQKASILSNPRKRKFGYSTAKSFWRPLAL
jgi:putative methyltransferase